MSSTFGVSALSRVFNDSSSDIRSKIIGIYTFLILANLVVWVLALLVFSSSIFLLGLAVTAYTFGLRHAVDADHISAIDNVTRKLMQEKKHPIAVGFFFSLGHSTIVVVMTILIALAAVAMKNFEQIKAIAGLIGTTVSS